MFQLTAARRRLLDKEVRKIVDERVSTHSRSKAAAIVTDNIIAGNIVSTHSRSKAAAFYPAMSATAKQPVSTHSRSKVAANMRVMSTRDTSFQLTAARRRLRFNNDNLCVAINISTHSRSKAAAPISTSSSCRGQVSTHSRSKAAACINN